MKDESSVWDNLCKKKIDFGSLRKRWKWAFLVWAILSMVPLAMNMVNISALNSSQIFAMPWLIASIVSILVFAILCLGILIENHK